MSAREEVVRAHQALLNGDNRFSYFEERRLSKVIIKSASVGYQKHEWFKGHRGAAFTYPCFDENSELLAVHFKSEARDGKGKRYQKWGLYADDLPPKGHGKNPDAPAKIVPFGMETLHGLKPGSLVVMCCGEEDTLSLRQIGFKVLSQPGAGLLEPVYARQLTGFEVVVFYDAGEEQVARKDALKIVEAKAESVRIVEWPPDASHGSDINERLVENPDSFGQWAAEMIGAAYPISKVKTGAAKRSGKPDKYGGASRTAKMSAPRPMLAQEARQGLAGDVLAAIEPHTEADPVAVLVNTLIAFGNAAGRNPHVMVGADRHGLNLNAVLVGRSAKGRKGMSWNYVRDRTRRRSLLGCGSGHGRPQQRGGTDRGRPR